MQVGATDRRPLRGLAASPGADPGFRFAAPGATPRRLLRRLTVRRSSKPTYFLLVHATVWCHIRTIAMVAAVITSAVSQPSTFNSGEFVREPITFLSLVSIVTNTINGGASTPFTTAA